MAIAREANARNISAFMSRYYLTAARKKGLLMGLAAARTRRWRRRSASSSACTRTACRCAGTEQNKNAPT